MKKIDAALLTDNFIKIIGQEWMLVTAGNKENFNTMTASWGTVGFLWNKPVVTIFIRPERHTFSLIEQNELFTLSFLGEENKDILKVCGKVSGRNVDKVAMTGLRPFVTESGSVSFEQARLVVECRKLYSDMLYAEKFTDNKLLNQWYDNAHGGLHKVFIGEIINCWMK